MNVVIIKYNAGNIYSVDYALKRLGITAQITGEPEAIRAADKVIFPGVGEANTTMAYLRHHKLDSLIRDLRQPLLGICIGLQLMCRHSAEGETDCIGIFDADVQRLIPQRHEDKIPHMGWNTLTAVQSPILPPTLEGCYTYFVHSYAVPPCAHTIALSHHTQPFSAALHRDNFYAVQFHPEKSGAVGETILRRFLAL